MEQVDIEAAKRLKNRMWSPGLKEFYEPEDVIRYCDEVDNLRPPYIQHVIEPGKFFTEEVLKEGLKLLKARNLKSLLSEVEYLKNIKIPRLEEEIKNLIDK